MSNDYITSRYIRIYAAEVLRTYMVRFNRYYHVINHIVLMYIEREKLKKSIKQSFTYVYLRLKIKTYTIFLTTTKMLLQNIIEFERNYLKNEIKVSFHNDTFWKPKYVEMM